jgi:hypothetical protein
MSYASLASAGRAVGINNEKAIEFSKGAGKAAEEISHVASGALATQFAGTRLAAVLGKRSLGAVSTTGLYLLGRSVTEGLLKIEDIAENFHTNAADVVKHLALHAASKIANRVKTQKKETPKDELDVKHSTSVNGAERSVSSTSASSSTPTNPIAEHVRKQIAEKAKEYVKERPNLAPIAPALNALSNANINELQSFDFWRTIGLEYGPMLAAEALSHATQTFLTPKQQKQEIRQYQHALSRFNDEKKREERLLKAVEDSDVQAARWLLRREHQASRAFKDIEVD